MVVLWTGKKQRIMTDQRQQRFDELQSRIEQVISSDEKNKANRLAWLFEEFLYNQKKKKVPYEVYCLIRYPIVFRPLDEYAKVYGLKLSVVRRISAGTYFIYH